MLEQFGGKVSAADKARYAASPNWRDGKFQNLEPTSLSINFWDIPELLYKQLCTKEERVPKQPLPVEPFNAEQFLAGDEPKFAWFGHSVVLIRMNGTTILIDPMLGPNAAPIAPAPTKRFSENTLALIDDFPTIDVMLISHDHYDHLDLTSIQKLQSKTERYVVAIGIKRHLVKWGIDADKITEMDWWDEETENDIAITFTPTRHFSGRGLTDRAKSLWGGWHLKSNDNCVWFSGDGGYGKHFKEIGERLAAPDMAFMECGQYNEKWHLIHMYPEEAVQAAIDVEAQNMIPVHWAGFSLAPHPWKEPGDRFVDAAEKANMKFHLPKLGSFFGVGGKDGERWWKT